MARPDKDNWYLDIALAISKRSTCKRRHFGAVIVKEDSPISMGYNGPVRGAPNCLENACLKNKRGIEPGRGYDYCRSGPMHAEVNAIVNAARHNGGTIGSVIYITGEFPNGKGFSDSYPCKGCQKAIINAGIKEVVIRLANGGIEKFLVEDWIKGAWKTEDKDIQDLYPKK